MEYSPWQRVQLRVLPSLSYALVPVLCSTLGYTVEGWEHYRRHKVAGTSLILCFWHNQIICATHYFRNRSIVVMSSVHFDGELTTRLIRKFGYLVAKGSSTHRALRAVLELKKHLDEGRDVGFTADGPRGPLYQVKPGPVWLSQKTGAPILPFHIEPERYWELKSWDHFRVPKPFSRALLKISPGFVVPPDVDGKEGLVTYQRELDRLKAYCESYWKRR